MPAKTWFVTGTDTNVGKTLVTAGLLHAAGARGFSTIGIKPVAAGCETTSVGLRNDDALALIETMNTELAYEEVNPVAFESAIAPHIAAADCGKPIKLDFLVNHCENLINSGVDRIFIEGAGGWRVPLNEKYFFSDIPKALEAPIILVVGMKLGCLNHALLTVEAIQKDGLELAGWVANGIDPEMDRYNDNIMTLKDKIKCPLVGEIPFLENTAAQNAAKYLDISLLE